MNRLRLYTALLVALVALLAGCDTATTTRPDAELIVGTWAGETLNARTAINVSVPVLDLEDSGDVARFTFREDGAYTFAFEPAEGRAISIPQTGVSIPLEGEARFAGNYTLDEAGDTIFLSASADLPVGLTLGYRFRGDDGLEVIADDPETLGLLVGLATDSPELQLLASVVTGGSIRYARN